MNLRVTSWKNLFLEVYSLRVLGALVADFGLAHLIEMERLRFCGDHRARLNAGYRAAVKAVCPCRGCARLCAAYRPAIHPYLALGALINGTTTDQSGADVIAGARTVFTPRHETESEIRAAVRAAGLAALEDVKAVMLETDGGFSVIKQIEGSATSALADVTNLEEAEH